MKEKRYILMWFFVSLLLICMPFAVEMGSKVQKDYEERGIDVEATVTDVTRLRRTRYITVEYVAQDGSVVSASASLSRASVRVGDVFIGKVLPEKPNEVRELPSSTLNMVVDIIVYGLALVGVISLVIIFIFWKRTGKFKREGIYAQARVVDYRMEGNYYVEILAFYTKEGVYFRTESLVTEGSPQVGRTYTIQYMPDDPNQIYIVN